MCVFNHPPTSPQLNFQAPKPTLTRKPMKTQTGLSISLPRSWTPPALKSSGLLEQVSRAAVSKLLLFGCTAALMHHSDRQIFTPPTGTQLHGSYIDCPIAEQGKSLLQLMCSLQQVDIPIAANLLSCCISSRSGCSSCFQLAWSVWVPLMHSCSVSGSQMRQPLLSFLNALSKLFFFPPKRRVRRSV